ncbi:phosphoribosylglycinamide synthetase [Streptomyces sp. WAC 01529]|uniref:ATP-grasp domain-containing protein n=1 Tax=Streptomyces sp. WAC 01529 TaxID=2203205 RepID=UPI000F6E79B7|nr:ATP-grasp domain-containing protein [Streptomyces sp. WAC 01529]AZM55252.1 phosphoribosylglycinamide synthetase [Streptomyces sp. WAC 01529]
MKSVLILSRWNAGGVAPAVERLRARGLSPVLISDLPDDRNRGLCDDHVLLDWDSEDLSTLAARLDGRGIDPVAVVNLLEVLMPWQIEIAAHYGLPGADPGREVLLSKTRVRERMRALGLSGMRFSDDPAEVDFFPAIIKPSGESGASRLVSRVDGPDDLLAYRRRLAELGLAGIELIVEEYLPGTEYTVDGPVVAGRFHPILAGEKPDLDETRHHDAGINLHPPQRKHIREGVRDLSEAVSALCADLRLDQLWLHVEGRTTEDGRTELVEINPRPGRGMHFPAVHGPGGVDPIDAYVSMSLGEYTLDPQELVPVPDLPVTGLVYVEADELGTVEIRTGADDLRALPGVGDADVVDGYQVSNLEQENFFLGFTVTADSVSLLRERVAAVISTLDYRIVPPPSV